MELPPWEPPGPPMSCQLRPHHWSVAIPIIKLFYVQPKLGLYYFNTTKETLDNIPVMFSYKSGLGEAISLFHLRNWIFFGNFSPHWGYIRLRDEKTKFTYIFPKRGVGGSKRAVLKISQNSSDLASLIFPVYNNGHPSQSHITWRYFLQEFSGLGDFTILSPAPFLHTVIPSVAWF